MKRAFFSMTIGRDLIKARFFGKRIPLIIGWAITKKCNCRCKYCNIWQTKMEELNTEQIFEIVDEMARMGTRKITFTGGEPLLREDIGEIIEYVHYKGIDVSLNSNGFLIMENLKKLTCVKILGLSLEGPQDVHDTLRQKGAFCKVLEAARAASGAKIKVVFNTTLNTLNVPYLEYLIETARGYKSQILFQPSTAKILCGQDDNPVSLSPTAYGEAIKKIIEFKKGKYRNIIKNSISGLKHLSGWPKLRKIKCASGIISCRIEPDGGVYHCERVKDTVNFNLNCKEIGFANAFYRLPSILCDKCCCALRVEASYILQLDVSALTNTYRCEF